MKNIQISFVASFYFLIDFVFSFTFENVIQIVFLIFSLHLVLFPLLFSCAEQDFFIYS